MSFLSDLKILYHMVLRPVRGKSHAERMENFYGGQAKNYDDFRKRLLKGREELYRGIELPVGGVWVDMGGGTGWNVEQIGDQAKSLDRIYIVDLSQSLLEVAADRFDKLGWTNVETVVADATKFSPPGGPADVVTFSYSLTMIPDWFAAIDNAWRILKPDGTLGVVDFYVARKYPATSMKKHWWLTRTFWPTWFATDAVFLSPDHLPYLIRKFETELLVENSGKVPYMPFCRVPYYRYVGQKKYPGGGGDAESVSESGQVTG